MSSGDVLAYNSSAAQIAAEMGVQVNDLYGFVTDAGTQRIVSDDGVHFTDEGKSLLGEAVAEYINGVLS